MVEKTNIAYVKLRLFLRGYKWKTKKRKLQVFILEQVPKIRHASKINVINRPAQQSRTGLFIIHRRYECSFL